MVTSPCRVYGNNGALIGVTEAREGEELTCVAHPTSSTYTSRSKRDTEGDWGLRVPLGVWSVGGATQGRSVSVVIPLQEGEGTLLVAESLWREVMLLCGWWRVDRRDCDESRVDDPTGRLGMGRGSWINN